MNPGDPSLVDEVSAHIGQHIGPVETVLHELVSDDLHIDIHFVPPAPGRPYHALTTSGMSERAMRVPEGSESYRYAELCMLLDPSWPLSNERLEEADVYWPIRVLKQTARFPHEAGTWLGLGHTTASDDPPVPFAASTGLAGVLIVPPVTLNREFLVMPRSDGEVTMFWMVQPLYPEELTFKLAHGWQELVKALQRAGVDDIVRQQRPRAQARRKLFGLF